MKYEMLPIDTFFLLPSLKINYTKLIAACSHLLTGFS